MIHSWKMKRRFETAAKKSHDLLTLHDDRHQPHDATEFGPIPVVGPHPTSDQLRRLLTARHARADFFGAHLFADPAWDILLLAYIAGLDQERLMVSTLCRESVVPATTTLRWIKALEQEGLLTSRSVPLNEPECAIELSGAGKRGMESYLSTVWSSVPL